DSQGLASRVAGEVKDFCPATYMPGKDLRRVGRVIPFAIAAAGEALKMAQVGLVEADLEAKRSWGVVLGSDGGAVDFVEEQYRLFFNDQLRKVSAYNVSSSTIGTLSSEI